MSQPSYPASSASFSLERFDATALIIPPEEEEQLRNIPGWEYHATGNGAASSTVIQPVDNMKTASGEVQHIKSAECVAPFRREVPVAETSSISRSKGLSKSLENLVAMVDSTEIKGKLHRSPSMTDLQGVAAAKSSSLQSTDGPPEAVECVSSDLHKLPEQRGTHFSNSLPNIPLTSSGSGSLGNSATEKFQVVLQKNRQRLDQTRDALFRDTTAEKVSEFVPMQDTLASAREAETCPQVNGESFASIRILKTFTLSNMQDVQTSTQSTAADSGIFCEVSEKLDSADSKKHSSGVGTADQHENALSTSHVQCNVQGSLNASNSVGTSNPPADSATAGIISRHRSSTAVYPESSHELNVLSDKPLISAVENQSAAQSVQSSVAAEVVPQLYVPVGSLDGPICSTGLKISAESAASIASVEESNAVGSLGSTATNTVKSIDNLEGSGNSLAPKLSADRHGGEMSASQVVQHLNTSIVSKEKNTDNVTNLVFKVPDIPSTTKVHITEISAGQFGDAVNSKVNVTDLTTAEMHDAVDTSTERLENEAEVSHYRVGDETQQVCLGIADNEFVSSASSCSQNSKDHLTASNPALTSSANSPGHFTGSSAGDSFAEAASGELFSSQRDRSCEKEPPRKIRKLAHSFDDSTMAYRRLSFTDEKDETADEVVRKTKRPVSKKSQDRVHEHRKAGKSKCFAFSEQQVKVMAQTIVKMYRHVPT